MWLLLYSVLGLISLVFTLPSARNYKLFNQSPTVRLTAQNFAQEVKLSPDPLLIVIYSESSELCQSYSKVVWPALAKAIGEGKFWETLKIGKNRVAAIEKGEALFATDEHDLPIIKIFPPNSNGVPLSKKINRDNVDEMVKTLIAIHAISKSEDLPETSQEWIEEIDEILKNAKKLALADGKEEWVLVETHTQIIRTVTTTRVENPFSILRLFICLIALLLLCCKWVVKCFAMSAPEDHEREEPAPSFHRDPEYSYDHPQPQARSEAIPLSSP